MINETGYIARSQCSNKNIQRSRGSTWCPSRRRDQCNKIYSAISACQSVKPPPRSAHPRTPARAHTPVRELQRGCLTQSSSWLNQGRERAVDRIIQGRAVDRIKGGRAVDRMVERCSRDCQSVWYMQVVPYNTLSMHWSYSHAHSYTRYIPGIGTTLVALFLERAREEDQPCNSGSLIHISFGCM